MIFDRKQLGYGLSNPEIKIGAKGYFATSLRGIRERLMFSGTKEAEAFYGELEDFDEEECSPYKIKYEEGSILRGDRFKFFYLVEKAQEYRPLNDHELLDMVGALVAEKKTGQLWKVDRFVKPVDVCYVHMSEFRPQNPSNPIRKEIASSADLFERFVDCNDAVLGKLVEEKPEKEG